METAPPQQSQVRGINKRKRDGGYNFGSQREASDENEARTVKIRAAFMHVQSSPRCPLQMSQTRPEQSRADQARPSTERERERIEKPTHDRGVGAVCGGTCGCLAFNADVCEETMTMT